MKLRLIKNKYTALLSAKCLADKIEYCTKKWGLRFSGDFASRCIA